MRSGQGPNMTYRLVESIGQSIVGGSYGVDHPFSTEAELAHQFGVSRSVTREAVKMLTAKGLLSARPRQGTCVQPESAWNLFDPDVLRWLLERKFSLKLLRDFTEVRLAIEPTAAALAARHATAEGLAGIRRGIERMKAAERGEDDPLAADVAFHVAILDATGNPFYIQLHELVNTALRISIRFTNSQKGVRQASVPAHERVVEAIKARDSGAASTAMTAILAEVMELIEHAAWE
ncbi:FadR/GntR family transcriptional regulator [Phenylobacterium montanum]|uniref:FadR family transcriptional regulator n=1 Tax=Phenylobacterium montanum TaxID=2823693 RepID=A0A975G1K5_9CAUL|nr:FadR/GntR family transcriptional regulator [Caulobacter sp. S6]QUD88301.1 FadR family transcriptional regulator [Caulobacter sp. S6]